MIYRTIVTPEYNRRKDEGLPGKGGFPLGPLFDLAESNKQEAAREKIRKVKANDSKVRRIRTYPLFESFGDTKTEST